MSSAIDLDTSDITEAPLDPATAPPTVEELQAACTEFDKAYENLQDLKAKKADAERDTEEKRHKALDLMELCDTPKVSVGRKQYIKGSTTYHKIIDEGAFIEWAKTQDESLTVEKPHAKLLNQIVRDCLDDGREFPPGLDVRVVEKITRK